MVVATAEALTSVVPSPGRFQPSSVCVPVRLQLSPGDSEGWASYPPRCAGRWHLHFRFPSFEVLFSFSLGFLLETHHFLAEWGHRPLPALPGQERTDRGRDGQVRSHNCDKFPTRLNVSSVPNQRMQSPKHPCPAITCVILHVSSVGPISVQSPDCRCWPPPLFLSRLLWGSSCFRLSLSHGLTCRLVVGTACLAASAFRLGFLGPSGLRVQHL